MELVTFGKEVLQNLAEQAASYRFGQSTLRHLDRALWVVEKCARWAVPPPLDQDERPQPELVRPLPWVLFLALLVVLRVTRESISLINLIMGKPPLRSADVVMYIQSKRRYLRTLKYQGSRLSRARSAPAQPPRSWYSRVRSLLQVTMCFRSHNYGNNNTTRVSNNDEVLVVKRKRSGSLAESAMERLLERMMQDLDDDDDDSSFTLTNVTSIRSDRSDTADSDQDTILPNDNTTSTPSKSTISEPRRNSVEINFSPNKSSVSTPERSESPQKHNTTDNSISGNSKQTDDESEARSSPEGKILTLKEETNLFLQKEISPMPKADGKIANGAVASGPGNKKGLNSERRDSDVAVTKNKATDITM